MPEPGAPNPFRQPPWPARNVLDLPAEGGFTDWEHWAWARILRGMPATMALYPGPLPADADDSVFGRWIEGSHDGKGDDPNDASAWPPHRNLSERFLRLVLFHEPYRSAPEREQAEFHFARIADAFDWEGRVTRGGLQLFRCRFERELTLYRARISGLLDLQGSCVIGALNADGLNVDAALFCSEGFTAKQELSLQSGRIGGVANFNGAKLEGALNADGLNIEGSLFCAEGFVAKQEVRLPGARIGGQANFAGALFEDVLTADELKIEDSLYCSDGFAAKQDLRFSGAHVGRDAVFNGATLEGTLQARRINVEGNLLCCENFTASKGVDILGAIIGGDAAFTDATLLEGLTASSVHVEGVVYLREMKCLANANLLGVKVGQDLQLRQSSISGEIDLTGARIDGELHLARDDKKPGPIWGKNAKLILRNVTCDALAGDIHSFRLPKRENGKAGAFIKMDLAGLKYERIGGLGAQDGATLAHASIEDLKGWLKAGVSETDFTPEPYQQLAAALFKDGHPVRARAILHAMRLYERKAERNIPRKLWLLAQGSFIGFGYKNLYGVVWFLALAMAAAGFGLWKTGYSALDLSWTGLDNFFRWFWFSIGNATPLLTLDDAHKDYLARAFGAFGEDGKPAPGALNVGIASVFYIHKMLGFMILTYLAAGLSGLASRDKGKS